MVVKQPPRRGERDLVRAIARQGGGKSSEGIPDKKVLFGFLWERAACTDLSLRFQINRGKTSFSVELEIEDSFSPIIP